MVIGIDGGALSVTDQRLEVGVYKVCRRLVELLPFINNSINYRIYKWGRGDFREFLRGAWVQSVTLPRRGYNQIWLSRELRLWPVDTYLGLSQIFPGSRLANIFGINKYPRTKMVGFIYDLCFLFHPEAYPDSAANLRQQTADLVRRADLIITISEATKRDIVCKYDYPASKIHVVYPGVDRPKTEIDSKPSVKYFLSVGALKRSKNIPTLLKAYRLFLDRTGQRIRLVIAGGDLWVDPDIKKTVQHLSLADLIDFPGHVENRKLPGLYRHAIAFVSPALREGFCLPAAEALSYGCPVIGSTTGAFSEVVGQAGILVDPADASGLSWALREIAKPQKRKHYASLIPPDFQNRFNWSLFARKIALILGIN
jgi:glycosyltransferase involved in cell wall biosynthesis